MFPVSIRSELTLLRPRTASNPEPPLDTTIREGYRFLGCQPGDSGDKGRPPYSWYRARCPRHGGAITSCVSSLFSAVSSFQPSAPDHVCGNVPIPPLPRRTSSISPPEPCPGGTRRSRSHARVALSPPMAGCAGDDAREPTPLPVQPPVRDGRLGLRGACVSRCWAELGSGESVLWF